MELRKMKKLFNGTMWLIFLPIALGFMLRTVWIMMLSVPLVIVWAVLVAIFWRCPECGSKLLRPDLKIKHCPECGADLGLEGDN